MRIGCLIVFMLLCRCSLVFPQLSVFDEYVYPQSLNFESYHAVGLSNMTRTTVADLVSGNPALIQAQDELAVGVTYRLRSNSSIKSLANYDLKTSDLYLPELVSFTTPYREFRFGLGFQQKYNNQLDFGPQAIRTVEHPTGTGEFYEPIWSVKIFSYSAMIGYTWNNIFSSGQNLDIGAQFNLNHFNKFDKISKVTAKLNEFESGSKIGVLYHWNKTLSLGMIVESGLKISGRVSYTGLNQTIAVDPDPGSSNTQIISKIQEPTFRIQLPSKIAVALNYELSKRINFAASLAQARWSKLEDRFKDTAEYAAQLIFQSPKSCIFSIGYLHRDSRFKEKSVLEGDANFIVSGFQIPFKQFNIGLEYYNSHLFSDDPMKMRIMRVLLDYVL